MVTHFLYAFVNLSVCCLFLSSLGLSVTMWKRYFKEKVSATVMLMEKVNQNGTS